MDLSSLQLATLILPVFVGVCLFILSRYVRLPAIVLLLVGGVLLGPEFLGWINPDSLGEGLRLIISLSVAIILFEGGLTLHPEGLKQTPKIIRRLLTLGVLITWFGIAALIYLLLDLSMGMSLLAGSLVIVTGPTVIAPLLKRIQVKESLFHILHWEGVLVDPIGVFIAILCFEWLSLESSGGLVHISQLSYRVLIGVVCGYIGGKLIGVLLRKEIIPEEQQNIFVFASVLFLFGVSEYIVHEAGILSVVIAGMVVEWANPPSLKHIQKFKSELTELAIALVFMLLAANLELKNFFDIGWKTLLVLAGVLFVIRPVSIMLCSYGTTLSFNEKLFLSWIAPRGVIAGSMASLFALELAALGHPEAVFLETFTFSVIASTIILQGGTAGIIARWLKVEEHEKKGWLIIGVHPFSIQIAHFLLEKTDASSVFLDTNADAVQEAKQAGFKAFQGNALSTESLPSELTVSTAYVLALTDNRDLNQLICEKWSKIIKKEKLFRWSSHSIEVEDQIAGMGNPVWHTLTKPSQLSYEFENKQIVFHQLTKETLSNAASERILMSEHQGKILFDMKPKLSNNSSVLVMERTSRHLLGLLQKQQMLFIQPNSYQDALERVIAQIEQIYPTLFHEEKSFSMLLEREREFPTTLAHGIAAPHVHCSSLDEPLCFIVKAPSGIELHTYEGEFVQLLFVLLSPENDPELHLLLLAEIAKIASDPEHVKRMLSAETPDTLIKYIKETSEVAPASKLS